MRMVAEKLLKSQHILYVEKVDMWSTKPVSPQKPEDNIRELLKAVCPYVHASSILFFSKVNEKYLFFLTADIWLNF